MTWSVDELATLAAKANPDARLISRQLLRNVLRAYSGYPGFGWNLPHDHLALLPAPFLRDLGVFSPSELPAATGPDQWILLIAQPSFGKTRNWDRNQAITWLWRQLFHGRVHASARRARVAGVWDDATTEAMIAEIGGREFREIRLLLIEEQLIAREAAPGDILEEFLAVLLELLAFETTRVPEWFPLLDPSKIRNLVSMVGAPGELLASSRPEGAIHPGTEALAKASQQAFIPAEREYDGREYDLRWRLARQLEGDGRHFEALMAFWDAAHVEPTRSRGKMHRFAWKKLADCLGVTSETLPDWALAWIDRAFAQREGSAPAVRAMKAVFQARGEMQHDPSEICPWSWLLSFGTKPFRRDLPGVGLLSAHSDLVKAKAAIFRSDLKLEWIKEIADAIDHFAHHIEKQTSAFFTPVFHRAFEMAGFEPKTLAESAALDCVIEEMVERLLDTRQLSFGDIRDILARNELKMPDIDGPMQWFRGDRLMALDRSLGQLAPGAYRLGEIYTRELQRLSSLFYATPFGRLLLLWLIIPFLGTLVLWKFPQFMHEEIIKISGMIFRDSHLYEKVMDAEKGVLPVYNPDNWVWPVLASVEDFTNHKDEAESRLILGSPPWLVLTFIYLVALIHCGPVQRATWWAFLIVAKVLRLVLWHGPGWVLTHPFVQTVLNLPPIRWFWTLGLKPAILSAVIYLVALPYLHLLEIRPIIRVAFFLVFMAIFASRYWIRAEAWLWDVIGEWMHDWGIQSFHRLVALFVWIARLVVDWISLTILKVTEWLRPTSQSSGIALVGKSLLTMILMPIMELLRFALIVLLEPQINPIKHFPTVTIGHKFMLVLIVPFAQKLQLLFGLNWEMSLTVSIAIISGIPGFFGFMVWELMENWRLYAANRPCRLVPIRIGSHGETFLSLFRPGFHSGSIAKIFRKLRHAQGIRRLKLESDLEHHRHAVKTAIERHGNQLLEKSGQPGVFSMTKLGMRGVRAAVLGIEGKAIPLDFEVMAGRVWSWAPVECLVPLTDRLTVAEQNSGRGPLLSLKVAKSLEGLDAAFGLQIRACQIDPANGRVWEADGRLIRVVIDGEIVQYDLDSHDQPLLPSPENPRAAAIDLDARDNRRKTPRWDDWVAFWGAAPLPQ